MLFRIVLYFQIQKLHSKHLLVKSFYFVYWWYEVIINDNLRFGWPFRNTTNILIKSVSCANQEFTRTVFVRIVLVPENETQSFICIHLLIAIGSFRRFSHFTITVGIIVNIPIWLALLIMYITQYQYYVNYIIKDELKGMGV